MKAGESKKLMQAMGAKSFDPMPPDQHKWQMADGNPPLHRMWSWLCAHTIHWNGQERSAFAIDKDGHDLFIDHVAKDLGLDKDDPDRRLSNTRHYWKLGVELGLWRNGTKEEGRRRLYLSGEVQPAKPTEVKGEEKENSPVCTYRWPPYILLQIKQLDPEKRKEIEDESLLNLEIQQCVDRELLQASRSIGNQRQDSTFQRFGIRKDRQDHTNGKATAADEQARRERLQAILPKIEQYVQTVADFVQTQKTSTYKPPVQSENDSATLLPGENTIEGPEAGRQNLQCAPPCNEQPLPNKQRSSPKVLPTPQKPVSAPVKLTEAESALFAQLASWKNDFEHCDFGAEEISRQNKGQVATVRRIVATAGGDMAGLVPYISEKLEKVNKRPAMGKRVRTGFGLILEWTDEYARSGPERERKEKEKREAFSRAAENSAALNKQLDQAAIAGALKEIKDPSTSERDRQLAREILEAHGIQYGVGAADA